MDALKQKLSCRAPCCRHFGCDACTPGGHGPPQPLANQALEELDDRGRARERGNCIRPCSSRAGKSSNQMSRKIHLGPLLTSMMMRQALVNPSCAMIILREHSVGGGKTGATRRGRSIDSGFHSVVFDFHRTGLRSDCRVFGAPSFCKTAVPEKVLASSKDLA